MDNQIVNHLRGGLGNQLFQVFTLISKALDSNRDFYIIHDATDKRPLYTKIFTAILDKITSGYFHFELCKSHIYHEEIPKKYSPIPDSASILIGHYESHLYFDHNKDKIIKLLKIDEMQSQYKFNFDKTIAIHFRFEDDIAQGKIQKPTYFINAFHKLKGELNDDFYNYKFVVFSSKGEQDDYLTDKYIEHINKNLDIPIELLKFKDLYPNAITEEEFIYMSNCNHFIKPNSTFSWFAFYLCPHMNKKAVVPNNDDEYYNLEGIIKSESDIYECNDVALYGL